MSWLQSHHIESKVMIMVSPILHAKITTIIFFSVRERAEFNKSCNLIGSGSGRNFPIRPALGGRNHKKCFKFVWKPFK